MVQPPAASRTSTKPYSQFRWRRRVRIAQLASPNDALGLLELVEGRYFSPLIHGRRIKLRYAHQGGRCPPVVVIHGNQTEAVPGGYRRYLENTFRKAFDLYGTPVRIEFRGGDNPYLRKHRKKLTPKAANIARRQRRIRKKRES